VKGEDGPDIPYVYTFFENPFNQALFPECLSMLWSLVPKRAGPRTLRLCETFVMLQQSDRHDNRRNYHYFKWQIFESIVDAVQMKDKAHPNEKTSGGETWPTAINRELARETSDRVQDIWKKSLGDRPQMGIFPDFY